MAPPTLTRGAAARPPYVNNVFYDGKGTGFGFSGGTSFSYKNNAYYGTPACWKDSSPIMLSEDPFVGTAPSMSRLAMPPPAHCWRPTA